MWNSNTNEKRKERGCGCTIIEKKVRKQFLIRRAKRGDVKAFSELYSGIYVELYKFALYTLKHPQEAEDAVSDTVVTAYEKISSLQKGGVFQKLDLYHIEQSL